jgi:hypothetical protein
VPDPGYKNKRTSRYWYRSQCVRLKKNVDVPVDEIVAGRAFLLTIHDIAGIGLVFNLETRAKCPVSVRLQGTS